MVIAMKTIPTALPIGIGFPAIHRLVIGIPRQKLTWRTMKSWDFSPLKASKLDQLQFGKWKTHFFAVFPWEKRLASSTWWFLCKGPIWCGVWWFNLILDAYISCIFCRASTTDSPSKFDPFRHQFCAWGVENSHLGPPVSVTLLGGSDSGSQGLGGAPTKISDIAGVHLQLVRVQWTGLSWPCRSTSQVVHWFDWILCAKFHT